MIDLTIVGRLGRDPEYHPAQGDKSQFCKFVVACDNRYGDLTSWFDCIAFGRKADNVDKFLSKGRQVAVRGRMEQGEPYTDKNGTMRRSWSVLVDEVEFLGSKTELATKDENGAIVNTVPDINDTWEQAEEDNPF